VPLLLRWQPGGAKQGRIFTSGRPSLFHGALKNSVSSFTASLIATVASVWRSHRKMKASGGLAECVFLFSRWLRTHKGFEPGCQHIPVGKNQQLRHV